LRLVRHCRRVEISHFNCQEVRGEEVEIKEVTWATAFSEKKRIRQKQVRSPIRRFAILFIVANNR